MRPSRALESSAPALLAVAAALPVASGNVGEYTAAQLIATLVAFALGGALVQAVVSAVLARRSSGHRLVASAIIAAWLACAPLLADSISPAAPRYGVLLLAGIVIIALTLLLRRATVPAWVTRAVAIFALAMVGSGAVAAAAASARIERLVSHAPTAQALLAPLPRMTAPSAQGGRPDIYVVILDNVANGDVQRTVFARSNRAFEDSLRALGFVVPRATRTSYSWTPHSTASLLDLGHVRGLERDLGSSSRDWAVLYRLVQRNRAARWLHEGGYTIYFQPSVGFSGTALLQTPHVVYGGGVPQWERFAARNRLFWGAFQNSVPGRLLAREGVHPSFRDARLEALRTVGDVAALPGPKLVIAHSLLAHAPYVVNETCGALGRDVSDDSAYVAALACTERLVLAAVTHIVASSPTPPVIVLQADHGSMSFTPPIDSRADDVTAAHAVERAGAFGAYLLPGGGASALPATVTPPNVLRFVFTRYLGASLPPVPDSSYYISLDRPYHFYNVTPILDGAAQRAGREVSRAAGR